MISIAEANSISLGERIQSHARGLRPPSAGGGEGVSRATSETPLLPLAFPRAGETQPLPAIEVPLSEAYGACRVCSLLPLGASTGRRVFF